LTVDRVPESKGAYYFAVWKYPPLANSNPSMRLLLDGWQWSERWCALERTIRLPEHILEAAN